MHCCQDASAPEIKWLDVFPLPGSKIFLCAAFALPRVIQRHSLMSRPEVLNHPALIRNPIDVGRSSPALLSASPRTTFGRHIPQWGVGPDNGVAEVADGRERCSGADSAGQRSQDATL